jgi:two-component system, OmpR family, sensor histidine kinase MtrB
MVRHTIDMPVRRSLRLSTRVTLSFGVVALFAGIGLATLTYFISQTSLLDQRIKAAQVQAFSNARDILLSGDDPRQVSEVFLRLPIETEGFAHLTDPRLNFRVGFGIDRFPTELRNSVSNGVTAQQRFEIDGKPYLGIGVYIAAADAGYFEAFPLEETEATLTTILSALVVGAVVTTMFATFSGWSTTRRLLRPLRDVADAAGEIGEGALGARLAPAEDPDLDRLVGSFNEMADAVQARIEREGRFASDVSHELRSPITALTAAVEVLNARREDLPERTQQALDVVVSQVRRFDDMVIDLLELARIDAGVTELNGEQVDLADLCRRVAGSFGFADLPVEVHRRVEPTAYVDKVRFERILGNLLENALHHGGGAERITIEPGGRQSVLMAVEDAGPGVAIGERSRIFERFARGSAARHRIGTGLGLALVAEHARALNGDAWVEDRPSGGARFVVRFPTEASRINVVRK